MDERLPARCLRKPVGPVLMCIHPSCQRAANLERENMRLRAALKRISQVPGGRDRVEDAGWRMVHIARDALDGRAKK